MATQFQLDQIITMHRPDKDKDELVSFRGIICGGKALVVPYPHPNGWQMAAPLEWLSPTAETKTKGTTK